MTVTLTDAEREALAGHLRCIAGDHTVRQGDLHYTVERIVADRLAAERGLLFQVEAWAAKNEIAEPPLDWVWLGEILRAARIARADA
jgi:hypothetical protein